MASLHTLLQSQKLGIPFRKKTLENQLLNVKKQLTETERGLQNQWLLSTEVVLSGIQESKLFDIFDIEAYFGTASVFDRISIKM